MLSNPKNILIVSRSAQLTGGIETQLLQLAQFFENEKQPSIFWFGSSKLKSELSKYKYNQVQLEHFSYPLDSKLNLLLFLLAYYPKQREYRAKLSQLGNSSQKVIHIHSLSEQILLTSLAKKMGFWVIWTMHNTLQLNHNFILKRIVSHQMVLADQVISVSESVYKTIQNMPAQHEVIHNGARIAEKPQKIASTKLQIGFVGRLHKDKNFDYFIKLIKSLDSTTKEQIEVKVAGDGPLQQVFQSDLSQNPFNYLGFLAGKKLTDLYQKLDLLIMPSGNFEGLPFVLLEAMSYGVIPVVSKIGPMQEVVKVGQNGYYLDMDLTKDKQLIESLIHQKNLDQVSREAHRTVKTNFSLANFYKKMKQVYGL